jgi:circadian clock protein KaiB
MRMPQDRPANKQELPDDKSEIFEHLLDEQKNTEYVLRLFVTGLTTRSTQAIDTIKDICDEELKGRYKLEVVDLSKEPELAKQEDIIAAPTLIKKLPVPLRRLIGDLPNKERVLIGLDLRPKS